MATIQNKVIHRFIRAISEYEEGGLYYNRVIPLDTQAYAFYPNENPDSNSFSNISDSSDTKTGLYYVFGDGNHTYTEIRDGKGNTPGAKEYPVFTQNTFDTKIDTLIAGTNVVISGEGSVRKISVPSIAVPDRFTSDQQLPDDLIIGDEIKNLDGTQTIAVAPPASLKENDIVYFASGHQLLVTYVDPSETIYDGILIYIPMADDEISFANLKGDPYENTALGIILDDKLTKENIPNRLYGIDKNGNQTLFHFLDVGIPDSPKDGKEYVRKDGAWTTISTLAVIKDDIVSKETTYSSEKIEDKLEAISEIIQDLSVLNVEIVDTLPEKGKVKTLYLVPSKTIEKDIYNEYMWINDAWELIGNTDLDLSGYATDEELNKVKEELQYKLNNTTERVTVLETVVDTKQDRLTAGNNIKIENNVISSTSAIVSVNNELPDEQGNIQIDKADVGLSNVDNTSDLDKPISKATLFVLDELNSIVSTKQDKLTAGTNITISEDNVISAVDLVTSYNLLTDKPSINNVELIGNKTFEELGLQPEGDYALKSDIPTKVSQLENDSEYARVEYVDTKADKADSLAGYGILDAYTKTEVDEKFAIKVNTEAAISKLQYDVTILDENKANKATTLAGYGINDAYTKLWIDTNFVSNTKYNYDINTINNSLNTLDTIKASKDEIYSGLAQKQNILTAGNHIKIDNSLISAHYLYEDLTDKPSINNVTLTGNVTLDQLGIQEKGSYATLNDLKILDIKVDTKQNKLTAGEGVILENDVISVVNNIESYNDLIDKPSINGNVLTGNKTLDELGIQEKGNFATVTELTNETDRAIKAEGLLNNLIYTVSKNVNYLTKDVAGVKKEIKEKQDTLIPGYGIRIDGNTISVDLSDDSGESGGTEESGESGGGSESGESGYYPPFSTEDFVTREEYEAKCNEYENKINALNQRLERIIDIVTDSGFVIVGVDEAVDF